jgi:TRAP-type C4-dicarboxylate transport system substrate-binding protein
VFKKISLGVRASVIGVAALVATAPTLAAEVTLSGASCFPIGSPVSKAFERVVDEINMEGKGVVQIDLKGGAPAIGSPFTLVQKMAKGAYDLVGCTEGFFGNVFTEAAVLRFAEVPFSTLRENGGLKLASELMAKKGIHYVGRYFDFGPFHLYLTKKIDKPDLTGLNLRVVPIYTAFFKSLGATVQTANPAQVYTYLENGTIQGYGWSATGLVPAWIPLTKYRVEPGFYSSSLHMLLNERKWNTLTDEQKAIITKVTLKAEAASDPGNPKYQEMVSSYRTMLESKGMTMIRFSDEETEKWSATAKKAGWDELLERSPEHGPKLMKLFTK